MSTVSRVLHLVKERLKSHVLHKKLRRLERGIGESSFDDSKTSHRPGIEQGVGTCGGAGGGSLWEPRVDEFPLAAPLPRYGCTFEKNSPSLAAALNWRMGSRSLKALVKALHKLHRVRVENSSCVGWK